MSVVLLGHISGEPADISKLSGDDHPRRCVRGREGMALGGGYPSRLPPFQNDKRGAAACMRPTPLRGNVHYGPRNSRRTAVAAQNIQWASWRGGADRFPSFAVVDKALPGFSTTGSPKRNFGQSHEMLSPQQSRRIVAAAPPTPRQTVLQRALGPPIASLCRLYAKRDEVVKNKKGRARPYGIPAPYCPGMEIGGGQPFTGSKHSS